MNTHEHAIPTSPPRRRELATGTAASLLLHALAVAVLVVNLGFERAVEPPKETTVEVILLERKPEPPPPERPPPAPLTETPAPELPLAGVRPPPPQLNEAPLAERSRPPEGQGDPRARARDSDGGARNPGPPVAAAPPAPVAPKGELSRGGGANLAARPPRAGGGTEPSAQDIKDFLLAQVLPFWLLDYRSPRYKHVVFRGHFVLRADGMLEPPFGKDDPWDPATMIGGYDLLLRRDHEPQRVAIESFLKATRAAQPFRLPPGIETSAYPRAVPVFFRLGDL